MSIAGIIIGALLLLGLGFLLVWETIGLVKDIKNRKKKKSNVVDTQSNDDVK